MQEKATRPMDVFTAPEFSIATMSKGHTRNPLNLTRRREKKRSKKEKEGERARREENPLHSCLPRGQGEPGY